MPADDYTLPVRLDVLYGVSIVRPMPGCEPAPPPPEKKPSAKEKEPCGRCKGSGRIGLLEYLAPDYRVMVDIEVDCLACKGRGYVRT